MYCTRMRSIYLIPHTNFGKTRRIGQGRGEHTQLRGNERGNEHTTSCKAMESSGVSAKMVSDSEYVFG